MLTEDLIERVKKIHDINGIDGANDQACLSLIGTGWESFMSPVAKLGCTKFLNVTFGWSYNNFTELRKRLFVELAKSQHESIRWQIAGNPHCPPEVLVTQVNDQSDMVRGCVTAHLNCPPEALKKLAKDQCRHVRESAASNPNCPPEILAKLAQSAKDEDVLILMGVAKNPNSPPVALSKLAKNWIDSIRISVVENPNCPPEVLAELSKETNFYIQHRAAADPQSSVQMLSELVKTTNSSVLASVARNPNCSAELLCKLSEISGIKNEVAENANCSPDTLRALAKANSAEVRKRVAQNWNCPPQVLEELAKDKDKVVRIYVYKNPKCPSDVLASYALEQDASILPIVANPQCPAELLTEWANSSDKYLRLHVAANPNCPQDVLYRLAHESFYSIRIAAIANPSYPAERREADAQKLSTYILSWFDEPNDKLTPKISSQELAALNEILGHKLSVTPASTPKKMLTTLKFNKSNVLVGSYPKVLDLRNYEYEPPNIVINSDADFRRAIKQGHPPKASIHICGKKSVEVIYFPSDRECHEYAVIEDLPDLKELHICKTENLRFENEGLMWLICKNLPNLKTITVDGGVFWLQLENLASLESIDVSKCPRLDYFSIVDTPLLKEVNVNNCNKLRNISNMPDDMQLSLGVTTQISENQSKSKGDGKIYKNMTFTDVDSVLETINSAAKLATRKKFLPDDFCYGQEGRPDFKCFGIDRLRPLEEVYTGGTGETYYYDLQTYDCSDGEDGIGSSMGYHELEECLSGAVNDMINMGFEIPELPEDEKFRIKNVGFLLDFLSRLVAEEKHQKNFQ